MSNPNEPLSVSDPTWQASQLIQTKLYIPQATAHIMPRPHLTARLSAGLPRLTLLHAPAGSGKTTLLSEWSRAQKAPLGWVSLDEADNDLTRFVAYLSVALGMAPPSHPLFSPVSGTGHRLSVEAIGTWLVNGLASQDGASHRTLVLDDYHLIEADAPQRLIAFLLQHLPSHIHLIIASRSQPLLPLATLRAREQLLEIADDLRFTNDETTTYLSQRLGGLAPAEVARVAAQTEGWVTGLHLATLALRSGATDNLTALSGNHQYVVDYLAEEVLRRQPPPVQTFLLHTAILRRLCRPLCNAVVGLDDTPPTELALLDIVASHHLFLVSLDAERRWFRYHHLFAEFLQGQLQRTAPQLVPSLHLRASQWYASHADLPEAIYHALAAQAYPHAVRLIQRAVSQTMERGEVSTIAAWIKALPDHIVMAVPDMAIWLAWTLALTGQPEAVERYLHAAETVATAHRPGTSNDGLPPPPPAREVVGQAAVIRATIARMAADPTATLRFSIQALANLSDQQQTLHSLVSLNLGYAYRLQGDAQAAHQALAVARRTSRTAGHAYAHLAALHEQARVWTQRGRLRRAARLYREAIDSATTHGINWGVGRTDLGDLLRQWNDLAAAETCLNEAIVLNQQAGQPIWLHASYIALARVKLAAGDTEAALEYLERGAALVAQTDSTYDRVPEAAAWTQLYLNLGRLDDAEVYLRDLGWVFASAPLTMATTAPLLIWTRVLIAHVRQTGHVEHRTTLEHVARRLEESADTAQTAGWLGAVLETRLVLALAYHALGRQRPAGTALSAALALSAMEGYMRLFVDEGQPILELLPHCQGVAPRYMSKLLAALGAAGAPVDDISQDDSYWLPADHLSRRELEILALLAAGLPNRAIAGRLFISEGTVRWHTKNIYTKLAVTNRTHAASRARRLGLLPA